jgi:hypothetical protein
LQRRYLFLIAAEERAHGCVDYFRHGLNDRGGTGSDAALGDANGSRECAPDDWLRIVRTARRRAGTHT